MWELLLNHLHFVVEEEGGKRDVFLKAFAKALTRNWSKSDTKKYSQDTLKEFLEELSKKKGKADPDVKTPSQLKKAADKKKGKVHRPPHPPLQGIHVLKEAWGAFRLRS